jgi:acyl-CoA synthetase (AMP-forming)/AMP-acid ligase II
VVLECPRRPRRWLAARHSPRPSASRPPRYALPRGLGVVGSLPLASHFGLGHALLLPTVLGGRLGLLARFDHRSLLALFASGDYHYWAGTPLMADLLQRAPLSQRAPFAPAICHVSAGPTSARVAEGFLTRFGAPLRPSYGRTEMGMITAEDAAPARTRRELRLSGSPSTSRSFSVAWQSLSPAYGLRSSAATRARTPAARRRGEGRPQAVEHPPGPLRGPADLEALKLPDAHVRGQGALGIFPAKAPLSSPARGTSFRLIVTVSHVSMG